MSLLNTIATIEKHVNEYAHNESPFEQQQFVSGYKMNSLINHPYHEALGNMGIPVGLVIVKDRTHGAETTCITRDMVQHGGASIIPNVIDDFMFEKLFDAISYKKKRVFTRKIKK